MMRWRIWSIFVLIPVVIFTEAKPIDDPFGGAICENTFSAFFVSDNTNVVWEGKVLLLENVTEDQCKEYCVNNKDSRGRSILCASFTYDHNTFQCNIYRHRSLPDGNMARKYDPGKRYFEKFCIPEDLPMECANTQFVRADESIIKGYAKNTSIVPSMEECASRCMREEFDCKSAMYFYEEGECITNIESAMTKPEDFGHPDDGDRVVYFQNGCTREYLNALKQNGKAKEPELVPEVTTPADEITTEAETEAPTTNEPLVETTEEVVDENLRSTKNKDEKHHENAEIGVEEEAPTPDQTEQEAQTPEPSITSIEIPEELSKRKKAKVGSSKKFKKARESAEQEQTQEPEPELEFDVEPTTQKPETSSGPLKEMEKELSDLLNESADAAASLNENDEEQEEKPQTKKLRKKTKGTGESGHAASSITRSSDEEALKEIQEIREMLKERKAKKQKEVQERQENEDQEATEEPPKTRNKTSKKKQLKKEEEEAPRNSENQEEAREAAGEEEERLLEKSEKTDEEQPVEKPKNKIAQQNSKKQYGAKQLRPSSDSDLHETLNEQESETSEDADPQGPKERVVEANREPLPVAEQDQEELKIMHPSRAKHLEMKLIGDNKKISIKPLKKPSNKKEEHDFTDPARTKSREEGEDEEEIAGYFSKWGDWTKCTQPGERRIRRRKCLDLKKCKGALMQVSYCPKELPLEEVQVSPESQEEPIQSDEQPQGPIRKPLPVESGSSENGHPPGIMPPNMADKELKPLPVGAPGNANEVWSPWLGVCQQFASTQPCKNGKVIGFESRECIAKDPKLCKGPFFRYCTLPC